MATFYAPDGTKPGDDLHYSRLENRSYPGSTVKLVTIDECCFNNYGGGGIERSNHRSLLRDKKAARYLIRLIGSHGGQGLAYIPRKSDGEPPKPLQEYLGGLADYPVISDDDLGELEHELESEAWESDGHDDFCKALTEYLDEQDPGFEHDLDIVDGEDFRERIFELWRDGCDAFNVNGGSGCAHEQGGSVHFYIREWFERASRHFDGTPIRSYAREACETKIAPELDKLAHETGFDCEAMRGALSVARDAFLSGDATLQGALIEAARIEACERSREREATASELTSRCS